MSDAQQEIDWKAIASRVYGLLWNYNTEPLAPIALRGAEEANAAARRILSHVLPREDRKAAIISVRNEIRDHGGKVVPHLPNLGELYDSYGEMAGIVNALFHYHFSNMVESTHYDADEAVLGVLRAVRDYAMMRFLWQPIAAAPRDGSELLLGCFHAPDDNGPQQIGRWVDAYQRWCDCHGNSKVLPFEPTHWMHRLPSPIDWQDFRTRTPHLGGSVPIRPVV